MTEQETNYDCNSINFGEFKREDLDKIMINVGYEKDPKEIGWVYKKKDKNTKKRIYFPENKGRLEKEKDEDIINNIRNKGLNPNARDFVPRSKEKNNNYVNQATATQYIIPTMFYSNNFYYQQMTPFIPSYPAELVYPMRMPNYAYGTYPGQEGMMQPNRMEYNMENPQTGGRVQGPFIPMEMQSSNMIPNIPGGRLNENKNTKTMNEEYTNEESNNNLENKENQDVIIDIEASNEELTETQENENTNDDNDIENATETINEEIEDKKEEKSMEKQKDDTNKISEQQQKKKKNKDKNEKTATEEQAIKTNDTAKSKPVNETKKLKSNEQPKKSKEVNKNSYASKVENGISNNKKKNNDKKKNSTGKLTKDSKLSESSDSVKEEEIKDSNEVKETDKEVKTEETVANATETDKKEEKKEEVKKEEPKRSWASLFSKEDTKSTASKTKVTKVGKASAAKTVAKSPSNTIEPVNLNDKIKISFEQVPIQPRGLVNNGNMCFMNAILQPLLYCAPFYNFIYSLKKETIHSMNNKPSIIESMIMFFDEFKVVKKKELDGEEYGESFIPEYVYDALRKFNSSTSLKGRQEDAEEYLGFLLNGIHDEFISKYSGSSNANKKNDTEGWTEVGPKNKPVITREAEIKESPINRIFGGRIKSILKCPGTKNSATIEPFLSLQLDITPSNVECIEDAFENLTVPETVPDYIVDGKKVVATKQNVIDGLPNVLLLHLKCFTFDHNTTQKVQKQINFKPELEIKSELLSPGLKSRAPYKYNLFAVVNHHGKMAGGGHYTCAVKQCNNRWLNFDDTKIQQISELEVTTPNKNQLPYLLLYTLEQKK